MTNSTPDKTPTPVEFAAYIGIDWGDSQHSVAILVPGSRKPEIITLQHDPHALQEWVAGLRERFGGKPCAICLEQSRGSVVYALLKYEFLTLFPINPNQLACYRKALYPSGAKDDPVDATLIVNFLQQQLSQLRPWKPDDAITRSLHILSELRRQTVNQRTALGQCLRQRLKDVFPLPLQLLDDEPIYSQWFLKLLRKYPTFGTLKRVSPKQLERLLPPRRRTADDQTPKDNPFLKLIRSACPLVTDEPLILANKLEIETLAMQIELLSKTIATYDKLIAEHLAKHPDAEIFRSFPGAGASLTPRLIGAFGTDRDRFDDATAVQQFSGIAPVTKRSGKSHTTLYRRACSRYLRQTFHELAEHSRKSSDWAAAYYALQRSRGKRHQASIRALAFKWIRILFHCWKERVHYNEQTYLKRLQDTASPILQHLNPKTAAETQQSA